MDKGNEGSRPPVGNVDEAEQSGNDSTGLKPIPIRFSQPKGADSLAKATGERLKEVVTMPVDLKSSEWRRDLLNNPEALRPQGGMRMEGLKEGDRIVAPLEGNASFEYKNTDKQPDGSLSKGKVVIVSKNGVSITIEGANIQLLVGASVPTVVSEDGVVKSSQEIPVKKDEPLFTIKNQASQLDFNVPQGTPTPGSSSTAV
jgi:hypothetical protein